MSNGWYRFARIDNASGHIVVDDGWGSYEGIRVAIFTTDDETSAEIHLTHEQFRELLQQLNEYHINTTEALEPAGSGRGDHHRRVGDAA
jgi:hypothetical protein